MNAPVRLYTIRVEDGDTTIGEYTHVFSAECNDPILQFWPGHPYGWQLTWVDADNPDGAQGVGDMWLGGRKDDLDRIKAEAEDYLDAHVYNMTPTAINKVLSKHTFEMCLYDRKREDRVRRVARSRGLILRKSRRRNVSEADYGLYVLVEDSAGNQRPGAQAAKSAFADGEGMTLLEVEEALKSVVGL